MYFINPIFLRNFFPWILWKGPTENNEIFLTFDDGPHPVYTPKVLEILKQHNARATFFLIGEKVLLHPGITEKIKSEGHTIGNHSLSHKKLIRLKKSKIIHEITQAEKTIEKITGEKPLFFRPPHGRFDLRFKKMLEELQYQMVIWSLLSYDYQEENHVKLTQRIRDHIHSGAIILFHDGHKNSFITLNALPDILKLLHQQGYHFKTLEELIHSSV
jgi:peptidoglycan/xylan/chitin deacetylase (PgdA/CDA1 family)